MLKPIQRKKKIPRDGLIAEYLFDDVKNLLTANQSNIEVNTSGFANQNSTLVRDLVEKWQGNSSLKVTTNGVGANVDGVNTNPFYTSTTPNQIYTGSAYVKGSGIVFLELIERDNLGNVLNVFTSPDLVLTNEWQRISISNIFATGTKSSIKILARGIQAITFWIDGLQLELGCLSDWVIGKGDNQILKDNTGKGNNGTLGSIGTADTNDPVWNGQGLVFDGVDDYVSIPHNTLIKPTKALTIIAVANKDWTNTNAVKFISCTQAGGWMLANNDTGSWNFFAVYRNAGYGVVNQNLSGLSVGAHFLAATYDGRYAKGFVDGVRVGNINDAGAEYPIVYTQNNPLILGAEAGVAGPESTQYLNGNLHYIAIYDRALSSAEIATVYNNLKMKLSKRGVNLL